MTNQLTESQLDELRDVFILSDKDEDGIITTKELNMTLRFLGHNLTEVELRDMVNEVDADGSGKIDFSMFVMMMTNKMKKKEDCKILDKDSCISATEPHQPFTNFGNDLLTDTEIDELIRETIVNNDDQANYDEFVRLLMGK
ncbi:hypothetical protein FBU30_008167 [Linnemannia zychae]|nr:hypothetical protein FBU30_008167 [Linnemannia zychae]